MKAILIILLFLVVIILISVFLFWPEIRSVCIKETCFEVELADTSAAHEKGLMYRKNLAQDKGMLFVFDKPDTYPFWMKNTLIPLDIIWIDENNKIVFISHNVQPCPFEGNCPLTAPPGKAKYVLEINAGMSQLNNFKAGDKLSISY